MNDEHQGNGKEGAANKERPAKGASNHYKEIGAFAFVLLFALAMFTAIPRQYPHTNSYKYAIEFQDALNGKNPGGEPLYVVSAYAYGLLGGTAGAGFNRVAFETVVIYLPAALGLICVVCIYLSLRTRLAPELGALGAVLLACSSAFMLNSLAGVYAPEILGIAAFSLSLTLFLASDVVGSRILGIILAALAGLALGANAIATEVGIPLAIAMAASAAIQLAYYAKEGKQGKFGDYAIRVAALLVFAGILLPYSKGIGSPQPDFQPALITYALVLPFIAVFAIVGIRDLLSSTKRYEMFFLALAFSSAGIALFDPVAAAPGLAIGAVFGALALEAHTGDRWLVFVFLALAASSALFAFSSGYVLAKNALALSLLFGVVISTALLLYDNPEFRRTAAFAGFTLLVGMVLFSGVLAAQSSYTAPEADRVEALSWAKANLPESSVIAAIGPKGTVEYLAERGGCDCNAEVSRFLLSAGDTAELKANGAGYLLVDAGYFGQIRSLAAIGNVSRPGIEVYFFNGYALDQNQKAYGYLLSSSGSTMRVPVGTTGAPSGEDVFVDGISVPYGRVQWFGNAGAFSETSGAVLPLYGERNNLFDIYFDKPLGLVQEYPVDGQAGNETGIRIYRIE